MTSIVKSSTSIVADLGTVLRQTDDPDHHSLPLPDADWSFWRSMAMHSPS